MTPRVVIADDHPMYRFGLCTALTADSSVDVVGECTDGLELMDLVERTRPDVVLTDLAMPGMNGVDATRALLGRWPDLGVLVLTMHAEDEAVFAALRAGARGYLLKTAERADLIRAVHALAAGEAVYGPEVARRIVAFYTDAPDQATAQAFPDLTAREREVLGLLAGGLRNADLARRLGLSDKTVRNHVSAILLKLGVPDRTAAALRARSAGIGTDSHWRPERP